MQHGFRNLNHYVIKTARVSGWLLLVFVLAYLITGYALCGKFGIEKKIDANTALRIHKMIDWPFVAVFAAHAGTTAYFAFKRWGWIGRKNS